MKLAEAIVLAALILGTVALEIVGKDTGWLWMGIACWVIVRVMGDEG